MRPILAITAFVTVSFGAHAALAQDAASFDAKAAVEGFLTDTQLLGADTATVGSVSESDGAILASNVAMAWNVSIALPDEDDDASLTFNVSIPELRVEGLEPTAQGYRATLLDMPTLTASFAGKADGEEPLSYDMSVTDYRFEDVSWGTFPEIKADPQKPVSRFAPLFDWLVTHSYQRTSLSKLEGRSVIDGDAQDVSYGAMSFGPVVDGRLETYEYGPVTQTQTINQPGPDGTPADIDLTMEYGISRGEGIDINPIVALLTGNNVVDGAQPVMEKLTLDGITVKGGDLFNATVGDIAMDDFTIDATGVGLLARFDPLVVTALADQAPNPMELVNLVLDVYGAFGVGSYTIADVNVTAEGVAGTLGSFEVKGVSRNGIDLFAVNNLDIKTGDGDLALGNFTQSDYRFPTREAVMQAGFSAIAGAGPDPSLIMDVIPTLGEISVSDLSVAPRALSSPVSVDLASIKMSDFIGPIPTGIDIALKGFQMPVDLIQEPQASAALKAMNADPLQVEGDINLRWDEDSLRVELQSDLDAVNVGQLEAEATLSGIQRSVFEDPMTAQSAIATAALNSVTVHFTNRGVADFLIQMMSQQTGVSADDFAAAMSTQAQMQISMMTGAQDLAEQVGGALRTFLADPQSLSVSAVPTEPLTFPELIGAAMTAPNALPGLLNFAISANN